MLSTPTIDLTIDSDDDWVPIPPQARLYRAASVGNSWGVTSMGRGFDWETKADDTEPPRNEDDSLHPPPKLERSKSEHDADALTASKRRNRLSQNSTRLITTITPPSPRPPTTPILTESISAEPVSSTPDQSRPGSPRPFTPSSAHSGLRKQPSGSRSPTTPRPRRRSSQQRVSLVAGRVLIAPMEPPVSPVELPPSLHRASTSNARGFISSATSEQPPPLRNNQSFLGERNISEFVIEKEIGRGAYGLVKLAREIQAGDLLGVRYIIHWVLVASAVLNTVVASTGHQTNY
jgi:protein-serine/threonine kinase